MNNSRVRKVLAISALGILIPGAFWIFHQLSSKERIPRELRVARVLRGNDLLTKQVLVEDDDLGEISAISQRSISYESAPVIAVVGQTGAIFLNERKEQTKVSFERESISAFGDSPGSTKRYGTIQLVDIAGDLTCEFLVRNSFYRAELIDHLGRSVWTYGQGYKSDTRLVDMTAGDVNGDGRLEYFALYSHGQGLVGLNEQLSPTWNRLDVRAGQIELVDWQNNGKLGIVYDDQSRLVLLDSGGNVISESETGHYVGRFSVTRWPTSNSREYVLNKTGDRINLIELNGVTVAEYRAPLSTSLLNCYGATVRLSSSESYGFAVVCGDEDLKRSVLYIYNSARELIYQEVLDQVCASIAAVPSDKTGIETLLIGAEGKVFEYNMRPTSGSNSAQIH